MKTLEEINGLKVWAVEDSFHTHGCGICMFRNGNGICLSPKINCLGKYYIPYEEEEEKTFTLSQINEVIEGMIMKRNIQSDLWVKEYIKALKELQLKLEQL